MSDPTHTPVVVHKYGGTSVGTADGRAALVRRVAAARAAGEGVIVVVSAMGRKGSPYATDTLLDLLDGREVDERERDLLLTCGETISSVVVAHELRAAGVAARAFSGAQAGILTDDHFGDATVLAVHPAPLRNAVAAGIVPVVAGFQGVTATGEITTLGRGGSDTTACAIGASLEADRVEVYTDVEGVMTADPRVCEDVQVLSSIEFEELFQMARHGAKVMHAPAAEIAMEAGVPVWIKSTFDDVDGTIIATAERISAERARRVATAVSHVDDVARFIVTLPPDDENGAHMEAQKRVYRAMADAGVSLDMFTPCGERLVFSVTKDALPAACAELDRLGLAYEYRDDLAKVTLVGAGMHGVPGVMARLTEALASAGVSVVQSADSHTTISVLVCDNVKRAAIAALHVAFGLGPEGK